MISNCVFTNNSAADNGGGIHADSSSPLTLTNCIFTNNSTAERGGGICSYGSLTLTNCVFTNNSAAELLVNTQLVKVKGEEESAWIPNLNQLRIHE